MDENKTDILLKALWECYTISGADTDGDSKFHTTLEEAARITIEAVQDLRNDYEDALGELYG